MIKRVAAKDKVRNFQGPEPDSLLSIDAATAILRILEARPRLAVKEQAESEAMKKHLAAMATKPRLITPIIFPLDEPRSLDSLLAPCRWTDFDLDADRLPSQWPWVRPDTGLLVWDPQATDHRWSAVVRLRDVVDFLEPWLRTLGRAGQQPR